MESKLTIEQLKNYFGTGLKCETGQKETWTIEQYLVRNYVGFANDQINGIKPICYRLSDLDKFVPELGFVPWQRLEEIFGDISRLTDTMEVGSWVPIGVVTKLFQWHFWPFGDEYFEQGLVIDKLKNGSRTS